ncbi:hypothetical protein BGZ73_000713 [Actinomortierella ambigua]|nr:hypothetical protein BGZ73_000713 [Actinomortierella ambigua]
MNFTATAKDQIHWRKEGLGKIHPSILDAIVWGSCGHRLTNVQSISIIHFVPCRYATYAQQLANIRVIDIVLVRTCCPPLQGTMPDLPEQIRAATHLVRLIRDASMASEARTRQPPAISLCCLNNTAAWWCDHLSPLLREFYSLLPISRPLDLAPMQQGDFREWVRFYHLTKSVSLGRVRSLVTWGRVGKGDNLSFEAVPFPQLDKAAVLQHCRNLTSVGLVIEDPVDEDVFDWMVQENQDAVTLEKDDRHFRLVSQQHSSQLSHTKLPGRIHLKDLALASRSVRWLSVARPLTDAVTACGLTLQTIDVLSWSSTVDLAIFHSMPQLKTLSLRVARISCLGEAFRDCPCLAKLSLHDCEYVDMEDMGLDEDEDTDGYHFEQDHYTFDHPWVIPSLECLTLQGAVAFRFRQASFQHMPNLTQLTLQSDYVEQSCLCVSYNLEQRYWQTFANLRDLKLEGEMALAFQWSLITVSAMPKLERLVLSAPPGYPENTFPIQEVMDMSDDCLSTPSTNKSLRRIQELQLRHWTIPEDILLMTLPVLMPDLQHLVVEVPTPSLHFTLEQMRAKWPQLREFVLNYVEECDV